MGSWAASISAIVDSAAINIGVHVPLQNSIPVSLREIPSSVIAGS